MGIFKFLKSQVILGNLAEDFKKLPMRFWFLFEVQQAWKQFSVPRASSKIKHGIDSELRKPKNWLSVFAYCGSELSFRSFSVKHIYVIDLELTCFKQKKKLMF